MTRRRSWRRRLEAGAVVAEVACRWQICPHQVFTWRRAMRVGIGAPLTFVPVVAETTASKPEASLAPARGTPAIEVKLTGAVLRVAVGTDEALLTTVLWAIRASAA